MRSFALEVTERLLADAVAAILKAAESPDEEHVHKMRVGIRRFQQSLRMFRQFLRPKGIRKVRRNLRNVMEHAGELRNHDIAMGLARGAPDVRREFSVRRVSAKLAFEQALAEVVQPDLDAKWRRLLGMEAHAEIPEQTLEG